VPADARRRDAERAPEGGREVAVAGEADVPGDHRDVVVAEHEPVERGLQAQVRAVLVQRVARVAPEGARQVERRDVDQPAQLVEVEALGVALGEQRLGVLDRRRRPVPPRRVVPRPERAAHGNVAEREQALLDLQVVGAASQRAPDRAGDQIRLGQQLADQAREARAVHPLLQRRPVDDHEVVAVGLVAEPAAPEHVPGIEEHGMVGAGQLELAAAGADPHRRGGEDDVGDLADVVLLPPAHVFRPAPKRAQGDHRAAVERGDLDPVPLPRVPRGQPERTRHRLRDCGHGSIVSR
jgi:hypothetical protein